MRRKRFTEEQVIGILKEAAAGRGAGRAGRPPGLGGRAPPLWLSPALYPAPTGGLSRESQAGLPPVSRRRPRGTPTAPPAPRRSRDAVGGADADQRALVARLLAGHPGRRPPRPASGGGG